MSVVKLLAGSQIHTLKTCTGLPKPTRNFCHWTNVQLPIQYLLKADAFKLSSIYSKGQNGQNSSWQRIAYKVLMIYNFKLSLSLSLSLKIFKENLDNSELLYQPNKTWNSENSNEHFKLLLHVICSSFNPESNY